MSAPPRAEWRPVMLAVILDDRHTVHLPAKVPAATRCGRPLVNRRTWRVALLSGLRRRDVCAECWAEVLRPAWLADE